MPRRTDLHRILIIGSGPIVIGQACGFHYSGTQAPKAPRADGSEVVLLHSNPPTIMTDPPLPHHTPPPSFVRAPVTFYRGGPGSPASGGPRPPRPPEADGNEAVPATPTPAKIMPPPAPPKKTYTGPLFWAACAPE